MFRACWVNGLAVFAFVVRNTVGSKLVSRISKGVLVFLRPVHVVSYCVSGNGIRCVDVRVPGAISAADVAALLASLVTRSEESRALMASPSNSLTRLLVDQILTTRLASSGENNLLVLESIVVIGNNRGVLLVSLDDGSSPLAAGNNLGLGALGGITSALGATSVLAIGAFLGGGEGGIALMAGPANTHADGFVHAENGLVGRSRLPFRRLDI